MVLSKEIIVRADVSDDKGKRKEMLLSALESGITKVMVRKEDSDLSTLGSFEMLINDNGKVTGGLELIELKSPKDQDHAMSLAGKSNGVILSTKDWAVIPLENLIARFKGTNTKVLACASSPDDAKLYLQTLEKGVDGIVIDVDDGNKVRAFTSLVQSSERLDLVELEVLSLKNVEMGDRVCIDTVSMMKPGEGMLIGSQASCMFLVQSESEDNGYVAARPFRVNAGAVHAYVHGPGGRTKYLGELKSGDQVVLVDSQGNTRLSAVGRCKIEQRPFLLLEATDGKDRYTTILQNAETVRMVGLNGSISVSSLKAGDKVLARLESGGRHFGMKIEETIKEI